jgi:predicted nucleic acid-binding protein
MVFLDTNIFLYAAGAEHPLRSPCQHILQMYGDGILEATTSAEIVQEVLYVLHRRGHVDAALHLSRQILDLFPHLLSITRQEMLQACHVMSAYPNLPARDAVHVATMQRHKLSVMVSADRHFDGIDAIQRVDPIDANTLGS